MVDTKQASPRSQIQLLFTESVQNDEFKEKVCVPYFKDIFKDLQERSDNKSKGVNKLSFLNYCQMPGLLAERIFAIIDRDKNSYLSQEEFLDGFLIFYCSKFEEKLKLCFDIYDFDNDGLISQKDIITIISCMPVIQSCNVRGEGRYTREGGGAQSFQERVDTLEEMLSLLQTCFGQATHIDVQQF